ncbi:MAG: calcium-binding protein [Hyphomonadaceae bacterium]|nr:calcium-binding protein [Hyphomonadaceae bacterium]
MNTFLDLDSAIDIIVDEARSLIYISTADGQILRYDVVQNIFLSPILVGGYPLGLSLSADGETLFVAQAEVELAVEGQYSSQNQYLATLHKINLETGSVADLELLVTSSERNTYDVQAGASGEVFFTTDYAGSGWTAFRSFDGEGNTFSPDLVDGLNSVRQSSTLDATRTQSHILVVETNTSGMPFHLIDGQTGEVLESAGLRDFGTSGFNRDKNAISGEAELVFISVYNNHFVLNFDFSLAFDMSALYSSGQLAGAVFSPTGQHIFIWNGDSEQVDVWNTTTWQIEHYLDVDTIIGNAHNSANFGKMDVLGDGRYLILDTGNDIEIIDVFEALGEDFTGTDAGETLIGTLYNDVFMGLGGNDTLYALGGNDLLDGGAGADLLFGGAGDDIILFDNEDIRSDAGGALDLGGQGVDTLVLQAGAQFITNALAAYGFERFIGAELDDRVTGRRNAIDFSLDGGAGNDVLSTAGGNDLLIGGAGADLLSAGAGNDIVIMDSEDIRADASGALDIGGAGRDTLVLEAGSVFITNGLSNYGFERFYGAEGNDRVRGNLADVDYSLFGGAGDDTLTGNDGNDLLVGGLGSDLLRGGQGDDVILMDSADIRRDGNGLVNIGGAGYDTLVLEAGSSFKTSGLSRYGFEAFFGAELDDEVRGNSRAVNYVLDGGAGDDTLTGNIAEDTLIGGIGNDTLTGGGRRADLFIVDISHTGTDIITDFDHNDTLQLSGFAFDTVADAANSGAFTQQGSDVFFSSAGVQILILNTTLAQVRAGLSLETMTDMHPEIPAMPDRDSFDFGPLEDMPEAPAAPALAAFETEALATAARAQAGVPVLEAFGSHLSFDTPDTPDWTPAPLNQDAPDDFWA